MNICLADTVVASLDGIGYKSGNQYIQRLRADYAIGSNATISCKMTNNSFINILNPDEQQNISNLQIYDESTGNTHTFSSDAEIVLETGLPAQSITKYYQLKLTLQDGFEEGTYTNTIVFNTSSVMGTSTGLLLIPYIVPQFFSISVLNNPLKNIVSSENSAQFNYTQVSNESMHLIIYSNTNWNLILNSLNLINELGQCFKIETTSPYVTSHTNTFTNFSDAKNLTVARGRKTVENHILVPAQIDVHSKLTTPNTIVPAGDYNINTLYSINNDP